MAKDSKPPCKAKGCGHAVTKHYLKGGGQCVMRGCPCPGYKS